MTQSMEQKLRALIGKLLYFQTVFSNDDDDYEQCAKMLEKVQKELDLFDPKDSKAPEIAANQKEDFVNAVQHFRNLDFKHKELALDAILNEMEERWRRALLYRISEKFGYVFGVF